MRMTKKPMMAKRATKAAPAKKTMAAKKKTMAAKKPMTVAGKTVKKYQVGGPAMGTMPKGMAGTLGSPRAKPTTTVTPAKTPPKTVGMQRPTIAPGMTAAQMRQAYGQSMGLNKAEAQRRNAGMATDFGGALGGARPGGFTNYGPGSGQFQQEAPPAYQYNPQTSGRSDPRAIAARQEQERQRIMQEQMMQGGGLGGGMPPNQRPPAQVVGGPRPPMPPKQGLIANNPGAMVQGGLYGGMQPVDPMGGVPANLRPMNQNDRARQQLMQQGMTPQQIQAQEAAIRQEMLRRGMPLGQGVGLPVGPRQGMGTPPAPPRMTPQQLQQLQQQMAQNARGMGMGLPGGTQQQMGMPFGQPMTPQQMRDQEAAWLLHDRDPQQLTPQQRQLIGVPSQQQMGVQGAPAPRQAAGFRKGGAVAKKKKAAATTRGRMAKPARKR